MKDLHVAFARTVNHLNASLQQESDNEARVAALKVEFFREDEELYRLRQEFRKCSNELNSINDVIAGATLWIEACDRDPTFRPECRASSASALMSAKATQTEVAARWTAAKENVDRQRQRVEAIEAEATALEDASAGDAAEEALLAVLTGFCLTVERRQQNENVV